MASAGSVPIVTGTATSTTTTATTTTTTRYTRTAAALSMNLSAEKPTIVLELGTAYSKLGFSGEHTPRCMVPTTVKYQVRRQAAGISDAEGPRTATAYPALHTTHARHCSAVKSFPLLRFAQG